MTSHVQWNGGKLRRARKRRGLTLQQVSAVTGIHASQLSRIERGLSETRIARFRSIARVLGVSLGTLVESDAPLHE